MPSGSLTTFPQNILFSTGNLEFFKSEYLNANMQEVNYASAACNTDHSIVGSYYDLLAHPLLSVSQDVGSLDVDPSTLDGAQKLLLLQIVLKVSDLGHVAENEDAHVK